MSAAMCRRSPPPERAGEGDGFLQETFAGAEAASGRSNGKAGGAFLLAAVICALVAASSPAAAQSVRTTPDRTAIAMGETVTLEVMLEGSFDGTRGPEMPDFTVVGKSSGSSVTIANGVTRQEQRIVLQLAPQRPGNLTIGAVSLLSGSKVVAQSRPVTIKVVAKGSPLPSEPPPSSPAIPGMPAFPGLPQAQAPAASPPTAPADQTVPEAMSGKQAFLLAKAPTRPLYAGEPIYVEYVLFTRSDVPLTSIRLETPPRLAGFVAEQAPANSDEGTRVRIKGQSYESRVLWRGAVMALGPGKAILDPLSVVLSVGDFFSHRRYSLASEPAALTVLPVPAEGRPADWVEGIVGSFALKATLDRASVRVGESAVLTVEVTGSGNLRAVKPPDIQAPDGVRVARVPAQDLDELVVDVGGVSGRRTFQYLLSPEHEGDFEIGRIDLPYFNSVSGHYERARSEILRLAVSTNRGTGPVHEALTPEGGHEPVTAIVAAAEPGPPGPPPWELPTALVLLGMTIPMAFWMGAEAITRKRRSLSLHGDLSVRRKALRRARAALEGLGRKSDAGTFWGHLDTVIRDYLHARFDLPPGLSPDEVRQALREFGAPEPDAAAIGDELDACAFGRFAPSAAQDRDRAATLARVRDRLGTLDRCKAGGGTGAR